MNAALLEIIFWVAWLAIGLWMVRRDSSAR